MPQPVPAGEISLGLSKYVRVFRTAQGKFLESLLHERFIPMDPLLEAVVLSLEEQPRTWRGLLEAVWSRGQGCNEHQLRSRVGILADFRLLVEGPEDDRRSFLDVVDQQLPPPAIDQIELTNVCAMRCEGCPQGRGAVTRPQGFIDEGLFADAVAQVAERQREMKPLGLQNAGESLLHDKAARLVALAARAGLRTELSTNPVYLTLDRYKALRDAGLSRLIVSLDGVDATTLERIRGPAARGAEALDNLDRVLDHRRESSEEAPELVVQMLKLAANAHQHDLFKRMFDCTETPGLVAHLKDPDANTPAELLPEGLAPAPTLCRAPWRTVVVLWDGRVVPCCHDANADLVLGDLKEQALSEIWESDACEALREQVWSGKTPASSPCARCAHLPERFRRPRLDDPPLEVLHW